MAAFVAAACRRPRCRHHCCGHFLPRHCRRRRDVGHLGVLCGRHPLPPLCGGRPLRFGSGARTSGAALGPLADDPLSPQRPPPSPGPYCASSLPPSTLPCVGALHLQCLHRDAGALRSGTRSNDTAPPPSRPLRCASWGAGGVSPSGRASRRHGPRSVARRRLKTKGAPCRGWCRDRPPLPIARALPGWASPCTAGVARLPRSTAALVGWTRFPDPLWAPPSGEGVVSCTPRWHPRAVLPWSRWRPVSRCRYGGVAVAAGGTIKGREGTGGAVANHASATKAANYNHKERM